MEVPVTMRFMRPVVVTTFTDAAGVTVVQVTAQDEKSAKRRTVNPAQKSRRKARRAVRRQKAAASRKAEGAQPTDPPASGGGDGTDGPQQGPSGVGQRAKARASRKRKSVAADLAADVDDEVDERDSSEEKVGFRVLSFVSNLLMKLIAP